MSLADLYDPDWLGIGLPGSQSDWVEREVERLRHEAGLAACIAKWPRRLSDSEPSARAADRHIARRVAWAEYSSLSLWWADKPSLIKLREDAQTSPDLRSEAATRLWTAWFPAAFERLGVTRADVANWALREERRLMVEETRLRRQKARPGVQRRTVNPEAVRVWANRALHTLDREVWTLERIVTTYKELAA